MVRGTSVSRRDQAPAALFEAALGGDRASTARLLSFIERGGPAAREVGRIAHAHSGEAYTVGLTGAPGSGKSTLTSALITHLRSLDLEVAVLAIDPSSPFTGGAILGDRVRMQEHATDPGVFIRSMATRGHLGGLALATPEAVRLLDAIGPALDPRRDGRRRPGRGRDRRQGRHDGRRREPGMGRQRAGQQGRADGDRRRVRDQQGRPQRRRDDTPRSRTDARPVRPAPRRVASPDRARRGDNRRRGRRSVGRRSSATASTSPRPGSSPSDGRSAPARSSARSSPNGCARRPVTSAPATDGTS